MVQGPPDTIREPISNLFKDVLDNMDDGLGFFGDRITPLTSQETWYILTNDPSGLNDSDDTSEFINKFITRALSLFARMGEALTGEARKDEVGVTIRFKDFVWDLCEIGVTRRMGE
jgi:hypothetical protein